MPRATATPRCGTCRHASRLDPNRYSHEARSCPHQGGENVFAYNTPCEHYERRKPSKKGATHMPHTPTAKTQAQIGLDDKWIEDAELEELLEQREILKTAVADSRKATTAAKGRILALNFTGPRRCGRFIIACSVSKPRSVSFDTEAGVRISIRTAKEEAEAD